MALGEITKQANKRVAERNDEGMVGMKAQWVKKKIAGSARDKFSKLQ